MMDGMPSMRARIDAGELVLCMALTQARTADVPWLAAAAGYDAVYVDLEHTATSLETTALLCSAAIGAGITPLVRVPSHDHQYLTRSLASRPTRVTGSTSGDSARSADTVHLSFGRVAKGSKW